MPTEEPAPGRPAEQPALDPNERERWRLSELRRYEILDTPPEENFDRLVRLASHICEAPISLMTLIDHSRQWFKAKIGYKADETPRSIAFCAHAIDAGDDVMIVEDAAQDARFADNPQVTGGPNIRFYAGAPMRNKVGARLGTICVIDTSPRGLSPKQQTLLTDLAAIAVDEMELRIKNRELVAIGQIDTMTGAYNRAHFMKRAKEERERARRHSHPLGLMTFDIDHFKSVNDTWGHAAGDVAICAVVHEAKQTLRSQDVLARIGGEEFAVLFPETDRDAAKFIAERIQSRIADLAIHHDLGTFKITISAGVGQIDPQMPVGESLKRIDAALYKAKRGGRNRVVAVSS
jgi:diguanylate cyclase (GGDEF)-like protein